MELWRRVFLISFFFAAIIFALFADLSPVVIVSHVDSDQQKREGSYMGIRLMTERTERAASLSLQDYIAELTKWRPRPGGGSPLIPHACRLSYLTRGTPAIN